MNGDFHRGWVNPIPASAPAPVPVRSEWLRPELISRWPFIVALAFMMLGPGMVFGLIYGLRHSSGDFIKLIGDHFFLMNGAYEAAVLAVFLFILHRRGWGPADLKISLGPLSTFEGFGLWLANYLGLLGTMSLLLAVVAASHQAPWAEAFIPKLGPLHHGMVHLTWPVMIVFTFLNAFYEELVYMSFIFNQVAAKVGADWAVAATVFIRLAIHTYQGTGHVIQIGTWAIIFGLAYRWRKRVWPLILAHACIDLFSMAALKAYFS